jgi:hypothetical protein
MANAKKCDICANYYEPYNTKNNPKKVNGFVFINETEDNGYYAHGIIDGCPECMKAVKTFVEELRNFDKETAKANAPLTMTAKDKLKSAYCVLFNLKDKATKDQMQAAIEEAIGYLGEALDDTPGEA